MTFCGILGSPPKCHRNYDFYKRNPMCFGGVVGGGGGEFPGSPAPPCGVVWWGCWGGPQDSTKSHRNDDFCKRNRMCFGGVCFLTNF